MAIKSVKFNNRVEILQKKTTRTSGGGFTETWTVYASKFAKITAMKDKPLTDGSTLYFQNMLEITIRYDKAIYEDFEKQNIRIRFGNKYFFVHSIVDIDEGRRYLNIWATENEKAVVTLND